MKLNNFFALTLMLCIGISANASEQALADACTPVDVDYLQSGFSGMTTDDATIWEWNSYNYAKARKIGGGEARLFTPALNLSGAQTVTLTFKHTHRYAATPESDYTLWVTDNWRGSWAASSWTPLMISQYATNNDWYFVDASVSVPVSMVGANTVFAFQYTSTAAVNGTWEIKNLNITSTCRDDSPYTPALPVPLPNVGNGRLKVCANNLRNYYFYYMDNDRPDYSTPEGFDEKTHKIVNMMIWTDADIYAFCEVEAMEIVLQQLADSLNAHVDGKTYAAVQDGINIPSSTRTNNIKSGFIYRTDKVTPVGGDLPVYGAMYYGETMRVQAFEEVATGERFTLSMNHFKAKDNSDDAGNATRVINATRLMQNLPGLALDPDILIVGDLNCQVGEDPLNIIQNAGYEEQLLKYQSGAYSHCWNYEGELIDHAYANATMAAQITGAGLFHITTGCEDGASQNYPYRYSDHDPYLVAFNLASTPHPTECTPMQASYLATGGSDLGEMVATSIAGTWNWQYNSSYGAKCQDKGGDDWLATPMYDLSMAETMTVDFDHTINYGNVGNLQQEQTMWITPNFTGIMTSHWTQLTIPTYPAGTNWTFVHATVNVPKTLFGQNTVIAFKYTVPADATNSPTWEIKNLQINVGCEPASGIDNVRDEQKAHKLFIDGKLYLLYEGRIYTVLGQEIK